jgi:ribosomal-protein-alanine N-acetyltransferase
MPCGGDWSIRSMGFADLDTVVTLEKRIFSSPWSADLFRYELGHDDRTIYLVLEECDRVVGYIGSQVLDQEIHVTNMAVEPEARRRGLGSALLLECVRLGLGRGARWVTLEVRLGNDEALDFYCKFGFEELGLRHGYYTDTEEDAIIMATGDIRSPEFTDLIAGIERELAEKRGGVEC